MYPLVLAVLAAGAHREAIDLPLRYESCVAPDPRLVDVQMFQRILLLVLPLHVFLLIPYRIPPDIEKAVRPRAATDEERSKIESGTILRYDQINRRRFAIADRGEGGRVEVGIVNGVSDVKGVVNVDIAIGVAGQVIENLLL